MSEGYTITTLEKLLADYSAAEAACLDAGTRREVIERAVTAAIVSDVRSLNRRVSWILRNTKWLKLRAGVYPLVNHARLTCSFWVCIKLQRRRENVVERIELEGRLDDLETLLEKVREIADHSHGS